MKKIIRPITALAFAIILVAANFTVVFSSIPYQGYTYNFWATLVPAPAAYVPVRSFSLSDLRCGEDCGLHGGERCTLEAHVNLGDMNDPTDMHVDSEGSIYIVDWGNNRIIVFDIYLNLIRVIDGYYRDGEWVDNVFNQPHGVFVTDSGQIFVADNRNHRVAVLQIVDDRVEFVWEIRSPEVEGVADDFQFLPQHVLVDRGGRIFVIVQRVFEGIMSFNAQGEFIGYFGTVDVSFSWIDMFWHIAMGDRGGRVTFVPREFNSMDMDGYGFVFTTHVENWHLNNQIMRLNPRGEDVLVNFNDNVVINGDQGWRETGPMAGPSIFTDIVARSHGRYSALCMVRRRVYTYDSEGNLLYVFAGTGGLQGMTRRPVSIVTIGEDFLILDAEGRGRVVHFEPTEYGRLINTAIALRYDGFERYAVDYWRKVVALDENFSLAWSGIGRSYLAQGYNARAMEYLERGMDVRHFSVAFRRNRLDVMQGTLPNILTAGTVLFVLFLVIKVVRFIKGKGMTE